MDFDNLFSKMFGEKSIFSEVFGEKNKPSLPYYGSGSCGMAQSKHGLIPIGREVEITEKYFDPIACKAIETKAIFEESPLYKKGSFTKRDVSWDDLGIKTMTEQRFDFNESYLQDVDFLQLPKGK